MYAVIKTGGKQYRVIEGEKLHVEKLAADEGDAYEFNQVLMVVNGEGVQVGAPFLEHGKVSAKVIAHGREKKVKILKFKRRKHHMKRMGHRQSYTQVEITTIHAST